MPNATVAAVISVIVDFLYSRIFVVTVVSGLRLLHHSVGAPANKYCGGACEHVACVVGEAGSASEPALVDKKGSWCSGYACNVFKFLFCPCCLIPFRSTVLFAYNFQR